VALTPGTRIGSYEITAQIGVGGMGEVYKATDTKLKREVAIKVLPEALATDAERLARFQRDAEGEVLASLNHPKVAAIHGLEDAAASRALVMELVGAAALADWIAQGAIPVDHALAIARQIAEALEAAQGSSTATSSRPTSRFIPMAPSRCWTSVVSKHIYFIEGHSGLRHSVLDGFQEAQ